MEIRRLPIYLYSVENQESAFIKNHLQSPDYSQETYHSVSKLERSNIDTTSYSNSHTPGPRKTGAKTSKQRDPSNRHPPPPKPYIKHSLGRRYFSQRPMRKTRVRRQKNGIETSAGEDKCPWIGIDVRELRKRYRGTSRRKMKKGCGSTARKNLVTSARR